MGLWQRAGRAAPARGSSGYWRQVISKLVMTLLVLATPGLSYAHIIELEREFVTDSPRPIVLTPNAGVNVHFTITPPPLPGPILSHGVQHYYFGTFLTEVKLVFDNGGVQSFDTPQALGVLTAPVGINQGFLANDLIALIGGNFPITEAGAKVVDKYQPVPEPASWVTMAAGLLAVGELQRRRRRHRPAPQLA